MPVQVALFGGSFNPPHVGHAQVVLALLHEGFDQVWAVPAGVHPFGKELAAFSLRAEMLRLALSDFGARVRICTVESELPGPSRTLDTVEELIRRHPELEFTLALGEDQKADLPRWHRIEALRQLVPFHFVGRGTWTPGHPGVRIPNYSSSEIRSRFARGEVPREFLHARVCDFILTHGIYGVASGQTSAPRVGLIGLGHVGGSLLTTLCAAGAPPLWCADCVSERQADARLRQIPVYDDWSEAYEAHPQVDFLLFCTPDAWRPRVRPGFWTTSPVCLHTGGMHRPDEIFSDLALPPDRLGILHPVRAVASNRTNLAGGVFSVTAVPAVSDRLAPLLQALQATPVPVAGDDRMAFHAVCALLANGSQVLEQGAAELLAQLGSSPATVRELVRALVSNSLEAWLRLEKAGFTGPWARGDEATAAAHLAELKRMESGVARLYVELKREAERLFDRASPRDPDAGSGAKNLPEKP